MCDQQEARRALILVAKVLQNLANGVKFGNKEAFMEVYVVVIARNDEIDSIVSFCRSSLLGNECFCDGAC